jgi:hypothetical protein
MNKGSRAAAPMAQPKEGKMDTSKPKGGKVFFGMMSAGRPGKKATKG